MRRVAWMRRVGLLMRRAAWQVEAAARIAGLGVPVYIVQAGVTFTLPFLPHSFFNFTFPGLLAFSFLSSPYPLPSLSSPFRHHPRPPGPRRPRACRWHHHRPPPTCRGQGAALGQGTDPGNLKREELTRRPPPKSKFVATVPWTSSRDQHKSRRTELGGSVPPPRCHGD